MFLTLVTSQTKTNKVSWELGCFISKLDMHSGYPCILNDRCWVQKPFVIFYWEHHNMLICLLMMRRITASYWCEQTTSANPKAQLFRSWNEKTLIKSHSQFIITHAQAFLKIFVISMPWVLGTWPSMIIHFRNSITMSEIGVSYYYFYFILQNRERQ